MANNKFSLGDHEKDRGEETNNPHIIARRHITKGEFTDAKTINLVQSQLGHTINQEELDKLNSIKPVSILFDDLGVQPKIREQVINSSAYHAKVRSKLNKTFSLIMNSILREMFGFLFDGMENSNNTQK